MLSNTAVMSFVMGGMMPCPPLQSHKYRVAAYEVYYINYMEVSIILCFHPDEIHYSFWGCKLELTPTT